MAQPPGTPHIIEELGDEVEGPLHLDEHGAVGPVRHAPDEAATARGVRDPGSVVYSLHASGRNAPPSDVTGHSRA